MLTQILSSGADHHLLQSLLTTTDHNILWHSDDGGEANDDSNDGNVTQYWAPTVEWNSVTGHWTHFKSFFQYLKHQSEKLGNIQLSNWGGQSQHVIEKFNHFATIWALVHMRIKLQISLTDEYWLIRLRMLSFDIKIIIFSTFPELSRWDWMMSFVTGKLR